jgi:hypothetical protein
MQVGKSNPHGRIVFAYLASVIVAANWPVDARAATLEIQASRQGSYVASGAVFSTENYQAGDPENPAEGLKRNYFVFDVSTISGSIASAELRLPNPGGGGVAGFNSVDPTETYEIHEVLTAPASLGVSSGVAIYQDLGDGATFGTYVASDSDDGTDISVALAAGALAAIEGASGDVAFGGLVTTLDGVNNTEYIFGSTSSSFQPVLVVQVEPAQVPALGATGLFVLAVSLCAMKLIWSGGGRRPTRSCS